MNKVLKIGLIIGGIAGLGAGSYFLYKKMKKNKEESSEEEKANEVKKLAEALVKEYASLSSFGTKDDYYYSSEFKKRRDELNKKAEEKGWEKYSLRGMDGKTRYEIREGNNVLAFIEKIK